MNQQQELRNRISSLVARLHDLYREQSNTHDLLKRVKAAESALGGIEAQVEPNPAGYDVGERANPFGPGLVSTEGHPSLYDQLARHARESVVVRIATAFISAAEQNPLNQPLESVTSRGGRVYVLTSLMNAFNRPETLRSFLEWENLELRIYIDDPSLGSDALRYPPAGFHPKSYLFHKQQAPHALIAGSANMTGAGLSSHIEWSYVSDFEVNAGFGNRGESPYAAAVRLFDDAWERHGLAPDAEFIDRYEELYTEAEKTRVDMRALYRRRISLPAGAGRDEPFRDDVPQVTPRPAQQEALKRLEKYRRSGHSRFAVVAATGIGKTFLSAFEVRNARAKRVLFVAHREQILNHARNTFGQVLPEMKIAVIQGGGSIRATDSDDDVSVFATVQTLSRPQNLERFDPRDFDYLVIDEFHHAAARSYQRIVDHFRPRYLLGMTATPERMDGQDVLEICNRNVAYEVRLFEAIDHRWLAPFQYFAIYDPTDYSQIRWTGRGYDPHELENALANDTRADIIVRNLRRYQPAAGRWKCLAFCSNVGHAQWMARAFNERGFEAAAVTGETPDDERRRLIWRMQDDSDPLSVLCSVDVLSEGIDIPDLSHILLLRPTLSPQVFLQQLGRGLRLYPGKEFVVVLDFVGNFEQNWTVPLALSGSTALPDTKRKALEQIEGFEAPTGCYVSIDAEVKRVWRERIERLFKRQSKIERMRLVINEAAAREVREPVALSKVRLGDLFDTESKDTVRDLVRSLGGWLRIRERLELLSEYEQTLVGGPGERFLSHVEGELKPSKSYKMAVLHALLDMADEGDIEPSWDIDAIAERFLAYYRDHNERRPDWPELAKSNNPEEFAVARAKAHILKMPLHYLSNSDDKFFHLDTGGNRFALVDEIAAFWRDDRFRELVRERVEYAEAVYWFRWEKNSDTDRPASHHPT